MKEVDRDEQFPEESFPDEALDGEAGYDESDDPSNDDPLSPRNATVVQTITLLRIYDILMAQLRATDPDASDLLYELHAKGGLLGPPPGFDPEVTLENLGDIDGSP